MGFKEELVNVAEFSNTVLKFNEPLKKHTSIGVGGSASFFAEISTLYALNNIIDLCEDYGIRYKIIGNGSNILASDKGYDGLVINLLKLKDIYFVKDKVRVMAGAKISDVISFCAENKLSGVEWFYGIPATLGGAVTMNLGAFNHSISDNLIFVETIENGKIKTYSKQECKFSYRKSIFKNKKYPIVCAYFSFPLKDKKEIIETSKRCMSYRKERQPSEKSFGSAFVNPNNAFAGKIIEDLGLKGYRIGGAEISKKHANFIINTGNATAKDVKNLIDYVKFMAEKKDIKLKEEVEYLGDFT